MNFTKKRSSFLIGIGACALVVSTGLAALATRDSGGSKNETPVAAAATPTTLAVGAVAAPTVPGVPAFTIPNGKQAISINISAVPGMSGFVKAGDEVNVYGALNPVNGQPADTSAKLVLQKVKVLSAQSAPDGSAITYVLAVDTNESEAIVYLTSFQKVYLTLARDDQGSLIPKGFSGRNA